MVFCKKGSEELVVRKIGKGLSCGEENSHELGTVPFPVYKSMRKTAGFGAYDSDFHCAATALRPRIDLHSERFLAGIYLLRAGLECV